MVDHLGGTAPLRKFTCKIFTEDCEAELTLRSNAHMQNFLLKAAS